MGQPKVSVIVPIYNVEKYLDRCIQSLLNQTLKEIEVILVDDESPDNCPSMCDEYARQDSRIKVIHKKNEGLGFARNSGLEIAIGEYVAFVDSDDFVELEMFNTLYDKTQKNKLDAVYCGINYYSNGHVTNLLSEANSDNFFYKENVQKEFLLGMLSNSKRDGRIVEYEMSVWHAIYKLGVLKKNEILFCSERVFISEDIIFHIDFLKYANSICVIPETLYNYCFNSISLTKTFRQDRFEKEKILFTEILSRIQEIEFNEIQKNLITSLFALKTRFAICSYVENLETLNYSYVRGELLSICKDQMVINYIIPNMHLYPLRYKLLVKLLQYKLVDCIITMLLVSKKIESWRK